MTSKATGDPRFLAVLDELREVHQRKSADYGTTEDFFANVRASAGWGVEPWVGSMIRATDKIIRLQSMVSKGYLVNESARDAFLDLASYSIIAACLFDETND